uniref:Uncharacterized protein n=1 Tax=Anguilla anguilla TaxID=7936 RepID=A0A0E9U450_ANGAN
MQCIAILSTSSVLIVKRCIVKDYQLASHAKNAVLILLCFLLNGSSNGISIN